MADVLSKDSSVKRQIQNVELLFCCFGFFKRRGRHCYDSITDVIIRYIETNEFKFNKRV